MIQIINEPGGWAAYIDDMLYHRSRSLGILLDYLRRNVGDVEYQVTINM